MMVWPLPRVTFRELRSIEEKRPVALLTTESVWSVWGSQITLPVLIQAEPERYDRDLFENLANNLPTQVQAIYVVGQGAPLQAGKIIASRNQKPLYVIPTALDSDQLLTPTAQVIDSDRWADLETGPATEVIVDWTIIQSGPNDLRGAGIVDVLSIITGLLDWRYAAQKGKNPPEQRFAPWAASVAAGLASQAIKSAAAIGEGNLDALQTLLNLMMTVVQLSNQLGHTRARMGSEHYLAQLLKHTTLEHAELVGPMLLFVAALHGQDPASLREALSSAGVRLDSLRATDVRLMLDQLPEHLGSYGFTYSVLNDLDPLSDKAKEALDAAGLQIPEDTWMMPEEEVVADVDETDLLEVAAEPTPDPEEDDDVLHPEQATQPTATTTAEESQPVATPPSAELDTAEAADESEVESGNG
ncbi:MAG TPA: iron-containing alcohol dehydrogenase [Aggregatilineaceae bacterium]|nr:iron-containing alcohol dehydrogenase [Aggregatilineaceae bacterium]